jgi:hypothetical protein
VPSWVSAKVTPLPFNRFSVGLDVETEVLREKLYSHRATMKLATAQNQTNIAMDDVTNKAGTRRRNATPIQNREKIRAAPRANATVDTANVAKRRTGRKENIKWDAIKDCDCKTRLAVIALAAIMDIDTNEENRPVLGEQQRASICLFASFWLDYAIGLALDESKEATNETFGTV